MGSVRHNAWLVLEESGNAALPVASALGSVAVEVPQIQFLDDDMVGYCWAWCGYMVCVSSWVFLDGFSIFYVMVSSDPEVDAAPSMLQLLPQLVTLGNWTLRPRASRTWQSVWVYSSWRNAWFNSGCLTCVSSWCFWKVFFLKEISNPEVDSRPALLGPRYAVWRSMHILCFRLLELPHFGILTLFPRVSRVWQPVAHRFSFAPEEFPGEVGSLDSPGDRHQFSLQRRCSLWPYTSII